MKTNSKSVCKIVVIVVLFLIIGYTQMIQAQETQSPMKKVWLDELDINKAVTGWGTTRAKQIHRRQCYKP